jgi:hypothetical protein
MKKPETKNLVTLSLSDTKNGSPEDVMYESLQNDPYLLITEAKVGV